MRMLCALIWFRLKAWAEDHWPELGDFLWTDDEETP